MAILISWTNPNASAPTEEGVRVYRGTSPLSVENLPAPLAVLAPGQTSYRDESAVDGTKYHYLVSFYKGLQEVFSNPMSATAPADLLPAGGVSPLAIAGSWCFVSDSSSNPMVRLLSDVVRTDLHSTRKLLAAVVVWEEKQEVWETELVTVTSGDLATTSGEWLTGLDAGDQITWKDICALMLVPSKSDVAATVTRVLGAELRAKYGIGETDNQAIGHWMSHVAGRAGAYRTIAFSNNPGAPAGEVIATPTVAPARDMTLWLQMACRYPALLELMQLQTYGVEVKGPNPRTITVATMDYIQGSFDPSGVSTGPAPSNYLAGKTGDSGTTGHQIFAWEAGSGEPCFGVVGQVNGRNTRSQDVRRLIMQAEAIRPALHSGGAVDPLSAQTPTKLPGQLPLADLGNAPRVFTGANLNEINSDYMYGKLLSLNGTSSYIEAPNAPALGANDFTVEVFGLGNGGVLSGNRELFGVWRVAAGARSWALQFQGSVLHFWYSADGTSNTSISASFDLVSSFTGGLWHICVQRSGTLLALYINGQRVASTNLAAGFTFANPASRLMLGARRNSGDSGYENFLGFSLAEASITVGAARYPMGGFLPRFYVNRF